MVRKHRKFKIKSLVVILTIVMITFLSLTIINILILRKTKQSDSLSYNSSATLTPSVCLINNAFLPSECTTDQRSFVSSLIDKINVNFNMKFDASDILKSNNYTYSIVAETIANEKGDTNKIVYDNTEELLHESIDQDDINNYSVNKDLVIDFPKYNALITSFKKDYVLALDSRLIIKATITNTGNYSKIEEPVSYNNEISLTIPLSEQTVNIDYSKNNFKNNNTIYSNKISNEYDKQNKIVNIYYRIDIVIIALILILIIKLIPQQNMFQKKINKILRDYDRAIAITNSIPSLKGLKVIEIASFEELLDVKDNLEKPILFYENKSHELATFIILNYEEAYVFTMKAYEDN
jgi:hypothetical protein